MGVAHRPWAALAVFALPALIGSAYAADAPSQAVLDQGKAIFQKQAQPACATCHTLKDADATGAIGPDLDDLQPSKEQIRAVLRDGSGAMPSFEGKLSAEQIDAVVAYVFAATHPQ